MYNARNNIESNIKTTEKFEPKDNIETPDTSIGNILTDLQKMKAELESNSEELKKDETVSDSTVVLNNEELKNKMSQLDNLNIPESFETMYEKTFGEITPSKKEQIEEQKEKIDAFDIISEENKISVFEDSVKYNENEEAKIEKPIYKFIGIAFKTYIIIEIKDEMYLIDQHAAHEKVLYEKIKKNYYSDSEKECQMLLLPDVITLTPKEMDIARDNMDVFRKAGFDLDEFGENTIRLNGVPPMCFDIDTKELFLDALDEINTVARTAKQEIEERFIATVACKSAVKAHMVLSDQEVEKLIDQLLVLENPFTCPHGRPTTIKMDLKDIEKKFARRK